jgi:hypothetical protein
MDSEAPKRVKTGGRQKGSANVLPDLRAITLKALMKAGGVEYLTRQAIENPGPFLGLLGKVMPREATVELTGELRIRQEVRRDLVEKVIVLLRPESTGQDARNDALEHSSSPLPAIAHNPDTLLKAQRHAPRESLSRSTENARAEGSAITNGILQRATAMHMERSVRGYAEEAAERIDGRRRTQDVGKAPIPSRARTHEGPD